MAELGPLLDAGGVLRDDAGQGWTIGVDENLFVEVEYLAERDALLFSTELGRLPAANRAEAMVSLLAANIDQAVAGGSWIYVEDGNDVVCHAIEIESTGHSAAAIGDILKPFIAVSKDWIGELGEKAGSSDASDPQRVIEPLSDGLHPHFTPGVVRG